MRVLVVLVLAAVHGAGQQWVHIEGELHPGDFAAQQCAASSNPPYTSRKPEFCAWYDEGSCCLPGHDQAIQETFAAMSQLGLACSRADHIVKHKYLPLRQWLCASCDPQEPLFRFDAEMGYLPANIEPK
eukprot:Sspe_Gene.87634::Locus_59226_Transcript_1_1_Confidence_1.000_Length_928::g.87634::m.87634